MENDEFIVDIGASTLSVLHSNKEWYHDAMRAFPTLQPLTANEQKKARLLTKLTEWAMYDVPLSPQRAKNTVIYFATGSNV